ncbi:hypothetical protein JL721_691 [Aureococcus anophagefferens]|nr:hypothetical protein JL721_691 [Aureococcus anophagefferens]
MRPMDVKQREITPQPGVRAHRACAFFGAVSLLLSLSTWSEIGSLGPFIEAAPVALVAYRSDLGEAGAVDHPVGVVAEPHRPTTLRLSSGDAAAWLVDGGAPNRGVSGDDAACEHVFAVPGATATVVATARKIVRKTATYEFTVFVKYVRRELRALTSKDRAAFLESMHVVWALETSAGKKSYGDDYRGLDYFAEKHLRGSAALVNAETALHYWDYVEDDARHGGAFRRSEIFDDDWFGALPPSNSSAKAIPRGPWAYARLPTGSRYGNAHGLARAPWNVDGAPFVRRSAARRVASPAELARTSRRGRSDRVLDSRPFPTLPGCAEFEACYAETTFAATMECTHRRCMNGLTHGSVHVNVGGHWGVDATIFDELGWTTHREQFLLIAKGLWRKGLVTFRPDARYSRERLNESGALGYVATLANVSALNATDELWARLHAAFCAIGTVGEMYTSASPTDPTFWHDAACAPGVCPGHGADDALPFRGLFGDNATVSNAAFYAATHPLDAALPYAYDALHWAACGAASPLASGNG